MSITPWFTALAVMLCLGFLTWLLSLKLKDVGIVDSLWSLMFLAGAGIYLYESAMDTRAWLLFALIAVWALRLSIFLTVRNWGEEEDSRYQVIRGNNEPFWIKSLYIVFGLQAALAWFISIPLLYAIGATTTIGLLDTVAIGLWLIGFFFEAVSDQQLYRFKSDPSNVGKVLDTGLWRYTRHPNYFGESLIWWAYYLFAAPHGPWWIIVAPILMTVLLLKVSGVAMMEKTISTRRPEYADYIDRTNAFLPGIPRAKGTGNDNEELKAS